MAMVRFESGILKKSFKYQGSNIKGEINICVNPVESFVNIPFLVPVESGNF
jgi:hypothetical protein